MFYKGMITKMNKGVISMNNARGAIMDTQAVAEAWNYIAGHGWCKQIDAVVL